MFEVQRAAFDAREIQDVVDHLQQVFGGFVGQCRVLGLLGIQGGGFQQLQHAEHAVHGGAQFMAHHGQEVRFGTVGRLRFLTGQGQLANADLLLAVGGGQCHRQLVDMAGQVAQLANAWLRKQRYLLATADGEYRAVHVADRSREAAGQALGEQQREGQGEGQQQAGAHQNLPLALAERVVGHADTHPAQPLLRGGGTLVPARQERVAQRDRLTADRGHIQGNVRLVGPSRLARHRKQAVVVVVDLHGAQIGCIHAALQQALQHQRVAGDHAEFGGRGQLVGNQLADLVALGAQILQA